MVRFIKEENNKNYGGYLIAKQEVSDYLHSVMPEMVQDFVSNVGGEIPVQSVAVNCPSYDWDWLDDSGDTSADDNLVNAITELIINNYIDYMFSK